MSQTARSRHFPAKVFFGAVAIALLTLGTNAHAGAASTMSDTKAVSMVVAGHLRHGRVVHVVVVADYALADWIAGVAGGEAILKKSDGRWRLIASSGGAYDPHDIAQQGVPAKIARLLFERMQAEEKKSSRRNQTRLRAAAAGNCFRIEPHFRLANSVTPTTAESTSTA